MLRPQEPECPGARPGIHASKGPTVTNLLVRLFVKNWQDSDNPAVRTRYGQFAGMVGIVCNVALSLAKGIIGLRQQYREPARV